VKEKRKKGLNMKGSDGRVNASEEGTMEKKKKECRQGVKKKI